MIGKQEDERSEGNCVAMFVAENIIRQKGLLGSSFVIICVGKF